MPFELQSGKMSKCTSTSSTQSPHTQHPIVHKTSKHTSSTGARLAANMLPQPTKEASARPPKQKQQESTMTVSVKASLVLLALTGLCWLSCAQAAHMAIDLTSTTPVGSSIEDPSSSEVSATSVKDESMCDRCYVFVEKSQALIDHHQQYVEREKKLLRQKQMAAKARKEQALAQAATSTTTTTTSTTTRRPRVNHMGQPLARDRHRSSQSNPSGQSGGGSSGTSGDFGSSSGHPTVRNVEGTPIVVSRLRVARSSISSNFGYSNSSRPKAAKGYRDELDAQIAQTKLKQKQLFNETCQAIHSVQHCVEEFERECLGNLQYHSFDSFATQWMSKLNCPSYRWPNIRPWPGFTRKLHQASEDVRLPVPRPLTSPEEIQKRLDAIVTVPFGVRLAPVGVKKSVSQEFNFIEMPAQQRPGGVGDTKGRERPARSDVPSVHRDALQSANQTLPLAEHLLLIPCCFMVIVFVLVLARSHSSLLKLLYEDA